MLSGTPTTAGTYTFTMHASDTSAPGLTGTQRYTITVHQAVTVTPRTLPVATVGDAYSEQLKASGGSGTGYTFALASGSSLPAGFTLTARPPQRQPDHRRDLPLHHRCHRQ